MFKTRQEKINEIRSTLKSMGITSKQVSVTGKSALYDEVITVKIKDLTVGKKQIEEVLNQYSKIDTCEYSGEVLDGGNTYTRVEYDTKALEIAKNEMLPLANKIIDENKTLVGSGTSIYKDDDKEIVYFNKSSYDGLGLIMLKGIIEYEDGSKYFDNDLCRYAAYNEHVIAEALAIFKYQYGAKIA